MDVAGPAASEQYSHEGHDELKFYNYFDLARRAHASEIAQLRDENEKLKEQVHCLFNHTPTGGLLEKITNDGVRVGVNQGPTTTSWDVDTSVLSELGDLVLPERLPQDAALSVCAPLDVPHEQASFKMQASDRHSAASAISMRTSAFRSTTSESTQVAFIGRASAQSSRPSSKPTVSLGLSDVELCPYVPSEDSYSGAISGWEKISEALLKLWNSDIATIHPSWELSILTLSIFMAHDGYQQSFGHSISHGMHVKTVVAHGFLSWGSLSPDGSFIVIWQSLGLLLCVYDIVMFPMQFVDVGMSVEYFAMRLSVIIFWSLDIVISLQTGFHTKEGYKELKPSKVFKRYAKTWMLLDIVIVAFDWIMLAAVSSKKGSLRSLSKMLRFARMVRVGRMFKLGPSFIKYVGQLNSEVMLSVTKLVLYLLVILILNHYIACVICATWNWDGFDLAARHFYLVSLHWAISHSALGAMDIEPRSEVERLLSCIMLVLSMVVFSTFLSAITTAITHLSDLRAYRVKQEGLIRRFFDENRISRELSRRVWTFLWKHNHTGKHRLRTSDVNCFALLPPHLLAEIQLETFLPLLVVHPMLNLCNERCPEAMVKVCMTCIEQTVLRPSEKVLWTIDAEVKSMLFVVDGELLYTPVWDPACPVQDVTVSKGMWACEAALWCQHVQVYGPLVGGLAGADVAQLLASEFQDIMQNSKLCLDLLDYARLFIAKFNECSHDPSSQDFLFNDPDVIENLLGGLTRRKRPVSSRRSSFGYWLQALRRGSVQKSRQMISER